MRNSKSEPQFVVCVSNEGYRASLIIRRLYQTVPDRAAARRGLIRVIDESGEDYLYPKDLFAAVEVTKAAGKRMATAS
jgi:hypothetical protein